MARLSRAQTLTGSNRKAEYYSDFNRNFAKTPVGNQLARVINDNSIQQALKNLILTNLGERLFQPNIGSNILATLFENDLEANLSSLEFYIQTTIELHEPRVTLIDLSLTPGQTDNEIIIYITYVTINNPEPVSFNFILKRVR